MTYPPQQQPGNWTDPAWPGQQPAGYYDPSYQVTGQPIGAGYPVPGYPPYGYPVVAAPPTNGLAIASMVISIVAVLGLCGYGLGGYFGIVGAILGHVSRKQIRERGENGDGMALAGIIVGWIATVIAVLATIAIVIFIVVIASQDGSTYDGATPN